MCSSIYTTARSWKLWTLIMEQFQDIEHIEVFYDYVTKQINSLEGWHHRLNTDLNHIIHPHFYMFIRAIQSAYAYNSAISSRHTTTGAIPPRKKLFVNRNAPLHDLENRYKQQALTLEEYLEKVMRLIGITKF
ncbi:unnamed protein product [Didymodactylos carnosus]|uniref:Uncharacterized protein n=1 Tax=Didymodactylos carnosus TaxID=1234261 RepID=A0A815H2Y3_9BILA|nr:unnamed protein product [Didymodactylos carnosus]CAF4213359.1 unnamed protein product [Didymodactylos carnosus]